MNHRTGIDSNSGVSKNPRYLESQVKFLDLNVDSNDFKTV